MIFPWFKHFINASDSDSLGEILEEFGMEGLGRYWRILELLGKRFDGETTEFIVSERLLREWLRFRTKKKMDSFLLAKCLQSVCKIRTTKSGYKISTGILVELQHRDFKKARKDRAKTAPKKEIENKKKKEIESKPAIADQASALNVDPKLETEIKFKPNSTALIVDPYRALALWNEMLLPLGFCAAKWVLSDKIPQFMRFSKAVGGEKEWREMLENCSDSSFLKTCGAFSFAWFFDEDKQMKMINGQYYDVAAESGGIQELLDAEQSKT